MDLEFVGRGRWLKFLRFPHVGLVSNVADIGNVVGTLLWYKGPWLRGINEDAKRRKRNWNSRREQARESGLTCLFDDFMWDISLRIYGAQRARSLFSARRKSSTPVKLMLLQRSGADQVQAVIELRRIWVVPQTS